MTTFICDGVAAASLPPPSSLHRAQGFSRCLIYLGSAQILMALNPHAKILGCTYGKVDIEGACLSYGYS